MAGYWGIDGIKGREGEAGRNSNVKGGRRQLVRLFGLYHSEIRVWDIEYRVII